MAPEMGSVDSDLPPGGTNVAADYPGVIPEIAFLTHNCENVGKELGMQATNRDFSVVIWIRRSNVEGDRGDNIDEGRRKSLVHRSASGTAEG
jgi:hypothetical protein